MSFKPPFGTVLSVLFGLSFPANGASARNGTEEICTTKTQTGVISRYYPDDPDGGGWGMANGERYSETEATAAHRTLPFGTRVKVTLDNGRNVTVRINDRGPYTAGRILDLNEFAAKKIGLTQDEGISGGKIEYEICAINPPLPDRNPLRPK